MWCLGWHAALTSHINSKINKTLMVCIKDNQLVIEAVEKNVKERGVWYWYKAKGDDTKLVSDSKTVQQKEDDKVLTQVANP